MKYLVIITVITTVCALISFFCCIYYIFIYQYDPNQSRGKLKAVGSIIWFGLCIVVLTQLSNIYYANLDS